MNLYENIKHKLNESVIKEIGSESLEDAYERAYTVRVRMQDMDDFNEWQLRAIEEYLNEGDSFRDAFKKALSEYDIESAKGNYFDVVLDNALDILEKVYNEAINEHNQIDTWQRRIVEEADNVETIHNGRVYTIKELQSKLESEEE